LSETSLLPSETVARFCCVYFTVALISIPASNRFRSTGYTTTHRWFYWNPPGRTIAQVAGVAASTVTMFSCSQA